MAQYDANIRIGVTGLPDLDNAIGRVNKLQQAINAIAGKLGLGPAFKETQQLASGFDQVAKSIRGARQEYQQFAQLMRNAPQAPQPRFASPRPEFRQPRALLPPGPAPLQGRYPALPEAPRSTGNFNQILDRLAGATTSFTRAQALLRALPENRITTDLAGRASAQRRGFEAVPALANAAAASRYFDPVLKEIAQTFAKYQRELRPTANDRRAIGPIGGVDSEAFAAIRRFAAELDKATFALSRRLLPAAEQFAALPPGVRGADLASRGVVPANNIRALPPGSSIPASQQTINVQAQRVAQAAQGFANAVQQGTQQVQTATAGGGGRGGFVPPGGGGGRGGFVPPGGGGPGSRGFPLSGPGPSRLLPRGLRPRLQVDVSGALQQSLVGGAFPALFGAGPGASAGGAFGGLFGGLGGAGFAGGLIGSLIGKFGDQLTALGTALKQPTAALEAMAAVGITTSESLKNTVAALEASGRGAEAQALVFKELDRLGGTEYVQNLIELAAAQKQLNDQWTELSVTAQKFLLPAMIDFTKQLAILAGILAKGDIGALAQRAVGNAQKASPFGVAVGFINDRLGIGSETPAAKQARQQAEENERRNRPTTVDQSDALQRAAINEAIARQKEAEDLRRKGIQYETAQIDARFDKEEAIFNLQKRAADLLREAADFRYGLEARIFKQQQDLARSEADAARQRAQIAIDRTDLALQQAGQLPVSGGESPFVAATREYLRVRSEGEADLRQKEVETRVRIEEIKREGNDFERETAKKVREFSDKAKQFARDVTKYEWEQQKKIYQMQIEAVDQQYAVWEHAYKRAVDIANIQQQAAANPLGDVSGAAGIASNTWQGVMEAAVRAGAKFPELVAAQWAEESAWGKSQSGKNNFFGQKGLGTTRTTEEEVNGRRVAIKDQFMDFPSLDASVRYLVDKWYKGPGGANQGANVGQAAELLKRGGYATNSSYVSNLLKIVEGQRKAGNINPIRMGVGGSTVGNGIPMGMNKAQLQAYLEKQGYVRTDSPTTRHKTVNHYVNALDMALPNTAADRARMKADAARLAAAGYRNLSASTDPSGQHDDHTHFFTPGGRIEGGAGGLGGVGTPMRPTMAAPLPPRVAGGQAPAFLPQMPGGVDVSNLVGQSQRLNQQQQEALRTQLAITAEEKKQADLAAKANLDLATAAALREILQPLIEQNDALKDRLAYQREYGELLQSGILPAEAEALAQLNVQVTGQRKLLDERISNYEVVLATLEAEARTTEDLDERAKIMERLGAAAETYGKMLQGRDAIDQLGSQGRDLIAQENSLASRRQSSLDAYNERKNTRDDPNRRYDAMLKAKGDLEDLIDPTNQLVSAANSVGDAFGNAFSELITGSKSANEALGDMFKSIGASFAQMAAQMLAQQAVLSILGAFTGGLGGGGRLIPGDTASRVFPAVGGLFADGGRPPVGVPSIVGEEGLELFIPGMPGTIVPNDMVVPYSEGKAEVNADGTTTYKASYPGQPGAPGSRGANGIGAPGHPGNTGAMGLTVPWQKQSSAAAITPQSMAEAFSMNLMNMDSIRVEMDTTVINGMEFVTPEQAQQGNQQAAQQGAKIAIAALQNSVGTRRKVGL